MENLISGLLNTALDSASSFLHSRSSSPPRQDADDPRTPPLSPSRPQTADYADRSTWAEVVGGHGEEPRKDTYAQSTSHHSEHRVDPSSGQRRQEHQYSNFPGKDQHQQQSYSHQNQYKHQVPQEEWQSFKKKPNEQEYASNVDSDVDTEPTQEELHDLSTACGRLWELDLNRLTPGRDYEINCGEGKKVYQKEDLADNCLFRHVNRDVFRRPTYARFYALLDNYTASEGVREEVTSEEKQEETAFIEEISRTAPIQYLFKYLAAKRVVSRSIQEFKKQLHSLWFDLYGRGGTSGSSCAFEHVFVGELKNGPEKQVSGFHNWIKFYVEEANGRVDYQGYILPRRRSHGLPDAHTQLLSIQFMWKGILKPVSSSLVGVSPEFEMALYTLCFYTGNEDNFVSLGPYDVNIKCYRLGGDKMGSAFPIAEE